MTMLHSNAPLRRRSKTSSQAKYQARICHVVVGSVLAGAQRCMLDILSGLDPARYERHVICEAEGPLTEALRERRIAYHLVSTLDRPIRPHRDWLGLFQIERICREQRFDLVHTHSSKGGWLGRIGARLAGVPHIVHHVHGYPFHEFSGTLERFAFSRIEKFAAGFCDQVIFVNHEEREMSIRNGSIPAWKGVTVYNGTDLELFDSRRNRALRAEFRREHGFGDDETVILVSGRLERQKQPLILPEIAAALDAIEPLAKWRVLVAGTGCLEEQLLEKVSESGMRHRFVFIGWSAQPHQVVSGADVVLLPSLWEGLPLALIEAQAAGLPIVASDVKGNREVVTSDTGYLCAPKDPLAYAKALARLGADPAHRRVLGAAARRHAEYTFNNYKNLLDFSEIYASLIN